ncbi:MAG: SRPBCC family protein [Nocardioidaceae bacterium]
MTSPRYRFRSTWRVPAPRESVYDVLADVAGYPRWWPQVRAVAKVGEETALVVCRSVLPYSLEFTLSPLRQEPGRGVLEARLHGDLDGWSRWTLRTAGPTTNLLYEQEVTTPGRALATAARVARPLLLLNHAWMMRGGQRGLLSLGRAPAGRTRS